MCHQSSRHSGDTMPINQVNLDALIIREQFQANQAGFDQEPIKSVSIHALGAYIRPHLRKPDFQRATTNWKPSDVVELVANTLDGELIPAIIMWHRKNPHSYFVIDGAHRLSALLAWILDDYGDGEVSKLYWGEVIPQEQADRAKDTRLLMAQEVGDYQKLLGVGAKRFDADDERMERRSHAVLHRELPIQWVIGSYEKAENAFFRINSKPAHIDKVELAVLRARKKPNAIATRALISAGSGHKYWGEFSAERASEIEALTKEIYSLLFEPMIRLDMRKADLPIAGQPYSAEAFRMILGLVNLSSELTDSMWQMKEASMRLQARRSKAAKASVTVIDDDEEGQSTIDCLKRVKQDVLLINAGADMYPGSLGLHPAVYFYNSNGKFQPNALLATVGFLRGLRSRDKLYQFTEHRSAFENFLVERRYYINNALHDYGSVALSVKPLVRLFDLIFEALIAGAVDNGEIEDYLVGNGIAREPEMAAVPALKRTKFRPEDGVAARLANIIAQAGICPICGARYVLANTTLDHIQPRRDGGSATQFNAQLSHPYCNSGYKEKKAHLDRR